MKKILILLATYNGEKYLKEQIESLLYQKGVQVYILVRDDGSSDHTHDILNYYQNMKKLEWYRGEHINVQKGYYELMEKASSYDTEYIAFCDQDDVWDEDKLIVAVNELEKFPSNQPALYYCGQRLVDENLNFIADHILNKQRTLETRFVLSDFAGCTGVFNRKLLDEVIKFKPSYMLMHDTWILKVCLCLGGNVCVDPFPHMNYRQHGGNTVGLGRSIPAYIKQVKQYLYEYQVERQMEELVKGYGSRMIPKYKKLAEYICGYKETKEYKKELLNKKNINFFNRGLNFTYWLKVNLKKL